MKHAPHAKKARSRKYERMKTADVIIVGSGSLAQGIVYTLSQVATDSLRVAIVGRSAAKVSRITFIANARAASFGTSADFLPLAIPEFNALAFSRLFRSLKPKVILLAASLQSPWESSLGHNAWTKLIATSGFGITLPLQLAFAAELSRAAADREAAIVNACYPDCVNVVLDGLGLRITSGIGNSAIVEAFCRSRNGSDGGDVRVVGHHGQLGPWLKGKASQSQPRVWVNGSERSSLRMRPKLGPIQDDLNGVTSSTATRVLLSLLTGETLHTSIPGVAGLPGGYPFVLKHGKFTLRLPAEVPVAEAIAHNKAGERLDGLEVGSEVNFVGKARRSLIAVGFEYAQGFNLAEWQRASNRMVALRNRLRRTSA